MIPGGPFLEVCALHAKTTHKRKLFRVLYGGEVNGFLRFHSLHKTALEKMALASYAALEARILLGQR